jgi:uncharacterized protein YlxW (UPF0749 family)
MPRLRFRLSNLVMLLIIIALVMALVARWRQEMDLRKHLKYLSEKNSRSQGDLRDNQRALQKLQARREAEVAGLQARVARLTALDESTLPEQPTDHTGNGTPKK